MKRISWLLLATTLMSPGVARAQIPQPGTSQPTLGQPVPDNGLNTTNSLNTTTTQQPALPQRESPDSSTPYVRSIKEPDKHVLAPGDQVDLFVRALPQEEKTFSIRLDGYFYYPLIGDVQAAGMTIPQLSQILQKRLSKVLWNPKFKLGLHTVVAAQVTVLGDVLKPGRVNVGGETTVIEAIGDAGGLAPSADPDSVMVSRGKVNIDVPLGLSEGLSTKPLVVQGGDVIYVFPGRKVTVVGEVWKPGIYALSRSHHSPTDAIHQAGGAKPNGALGRVVLQRPSIPGGKLMDLTPNLKDATNDTTEMVEGDTLSIPPRQCVVFAGAPKVIPLNGGENILQVITATGVDSNLSHIQVIRAADIKEGKNVSEKIDLQKFIKHQDRSVLVPINDGDVVMLDVPKQGQQNFLQNAMQLLYPISLIRMFLP